MRFSQLYKQIPLVLVFGLLFSCSESQTFDSEQEMWTYLQDEDNEYVQTKHIKGIDYALVYKPIDLLVNQTLTAYSEKAVDSLRNHYNKYLYFNLSFSKNNQELLSTVPKNRNEFGAMVNQLAFGMSNYVYAYTKTKDTLNLVDYIYPRMYGVSNGTKMMFVYEANKEELAEDYFFVEIKDMGFNTGDIRFKIPTKIIHNQPKLDIQKIKSRSK